MLGAVLLQNAIWVLPETARTTEHFRWLVSEIQEMNGEASLWQSNLLLGMQENMLIQKFKDQADSEYAALLKRLSRNDTDFADVSRRYQQIEREDYFQSELGLQVRKRLMALRGRRK